MTERNPYSTGLAATAGIGIGLGLLLGVISNGIDATIPSLGAYGINEDALIWKTGTGVVADAAFSLGIIAVIGLAVLSGMEWRLARMPIGLATAQPLGAPASVSEAPEPDQGSNENSGDVSPKQGATPA